MAVQLEIITTEDLSAFVDGQSDTDLTEAVEELSEQDDRCSEIISAFMMQTTLLRQSLDPILEEPVPERLIDLVRAHKVPDEVSTPE
jgi:anti-sigma factor RsiW